MDRVKLTEPASQGSEATDYLRVLKANRRLLIGITLVCTVAAIVASLLQEPSYEAKSSLAFRDVNQDLGVIGVSVPLAQTAAELAAAGADTATDPEVAAAVKRRLGSGRSLRSLADSVSADVDAKSNLVKLTASDHKASGAARLSNAFATEAAAITNEHTRKRFRNAARDLRGRVAAIPKSSPLRTGLQGQLSNLETLSTLAEPARVVERASAPSRPASPKLAFNAALGLVIGLVLALVAAFGRSSLDQRLKESKDVERELELPMVGKLRGDALGHLPAAMNGALPLDGIDLEALRMLRRNVELLGIERRIKLVAVTSPLPEEGKSTVAVALAFMAAAAGRRTLLVEADLRRPVFAQRLGIRPTPGLTDHLLDDVALRDALVALPTDGAGGGASSGQVAELFCLPAGSEVSQTDELLGSNSFKKFAAHAAEQFDFIVFDTSPLLPVADTLELIPLVDGVLLCVRLDQTTREQAAAAKATLDRLPGSRKGIVVTGTAPDGDYYDSYGYAPAGEHEQP